MLSFCILRICLMVLLCIYCESLIISYNVGATKERSKRKEKTTRTGRVLWIQYTISNKINRKKQHGKWMESFIIV